MKVSTFSLNRSMASDSQSHQRSRDKHERKVTQLKKNAREKLRRAKGVLARSWRVG